MQNNLLITRIQERVNDLDDPDLSETGKLLGTFDPSDDRLCQAVSHALVVYLDSDDIESAFVALLPDLLEITESDFGFLAEVQYGWNDTPYLQSHAVTNIYKPGYTRNDVVSNLQFYNLNTLNGAIMTEQAPVVTNTPESDPRSGGVPFGHARLTSYCGLPFIVDNVLIGAVALANRSDGYASGLVDQLHPMCDVAGRMILSARNRNNAG